MITTSRRPTDAFSSSRHAARMRRFARLRTTAPPSRDAATIPTRDSGSTPGDSYTIIDSKYPTLRAALTRSKSEPLRKRPTFIK